jgi:hypothetical protein
MRKSKLRVWWVPQIPGKPFLVPVATLAEAKLLTDTLAAYDLFQFENRIKPDYANAGGVQVFDPLDTEDSPAGSWVDWYPDEAEEAIIRDLFGDIDHDRLLNDLTLDQVRRLDGALSR